MRSRLVPLVLLLLPGLASADEKIDYVRDVKPLLRDRCASCHGALRQRAKLRLDTAGLVRKGGSSGPAIVPGKSAESLLLARVTGANGQKRMPPEGEGEPLRDSDIAKLRKWIDQGANGTDEPVPPDPREHWAFRPLEKPSLPRPADAAWQTNPIDAFIAAEHETRKLRPTTTAPKEMLLRRVYLDLVGLPPTREELHAFLADSSDNAYEKVVDRLLASPQYGERWARHWMDVWRYSDWYGRRAVPDVWNSAPQIWRWRDWIVKSLNTNKGYDRLVQEMLAADEIAPGDDEAVVATGFLVRNWYALNPNQWMRDNVEHTGKAFLGLTFNCAHCHDHKYDPISQEEYFRFRAFFEPLEMRQDRVPAEADPGPFQRYDYSVLRKVVLTGLVRVFDERFDAKTLMYVGGDERNVMANKPPVKPGAPAFLGGDRLQITEIELPATVAYPGLKPFIQQEETARREKDATTAKQTLETLRLSKEKNDTAIFAADARVATAEAELTSIRARIAADNARYHKTDGDPAILAKAAFRAERTAAVASAREKMLLAEQGLAAAKAKPDAATVQKAEQALAAAKKNLEGAEQAMKMEGDKYTPLSPLYPAKSTGRRKALAEWIVGRDNPLSPRVAVNHVWMRHFGRPLVESVFDFGNNGQRPSHPQLLDWLAAEFRDSGWDMKKLHRLIVTSLAYRLDSRGSAVAEANAADGDNRYLWQFPRRRIEAEAVRDAILHTAGQLDLTLGGPVLDNTKEVKRRSLYFTVYPEGGGHLKFLTMFDAPDPCDCYRRSASTMPQQALVMTNGPLVIDQGRVLARKLWADVAKTSGGEKEFVKAAFEQVLTRGPTEQELAVCVEFLTKQAELFRGAQTQPTGTGGVPASPDPAMRARESLVRSLFSHDEFITMR